MCPSDLQRDSMSKHDRMRRRMPVGLTKQPGLDIIRNDFSLQKRVILQEDHGFESISITIRDNLHPSLPAAM